MVKAHVEICCRECGEKFHFTVDAAKLAEYEDGNIKVQDAFPELTPDQRELFISGLCGTCFDKIFESY